MASIKKVLLALLLAICLGQAGLPAQSYSGGSLGIGLRNTVNLFPGESMRGLGAGGQFRLGFGPRVNTEWFFDYINSNQKDDWASRLDYHIGWGVQFALFNDFGGSQWTPFLIGGQCFDLTRVRVLRSGEESPLVFSAAVQAGVGISRFLLPRLEFNAQAQYMMHLSKDVHLHEEPSGLPGDYSIEVHEGASLAGHVLLTVSFSYYFLQLWNR